jgi:DNA-binding CsgD family transcriptional regulator
MSRLTKREREVVSLLAQGKRQTEIARVLCVSTRTVEAHTRNARAKVGAASAFELAVRAAVEEERKK